MFQNAKFYLINNASLDYRRAGHGSNAINLKVKKKCEIVPFTMSITTDEEVNNKSCRDLETRLSEKLARTEWDLTLKFVDWKLVKKSNSLKLEMRDAVVSGEILKQLHSLMLYNTATAQLDINMSGSLEFKIHGVGASSTVVNFNTELYPFLKDDGYDHSKYICSSICNELETTISTRTEDSLKCSFLVSNLKLWVEGGEYDLAYAEPHKTVTGQKKLLETGLHSDIKIVAKDNATIPCHELVLIAQSSVLEKMLKQDNFVEAQSRQVPMKDRSKEEVMAFLRFLYFGDLEASLSDSTLAVTLYEMGHYYDVQELEKAIKPVILSRPAYSFEVGAALQLFSMACGSEDLNLKRKAADVLEIRREKEILESVQFNQLTASVAKELFVRSRRKF